MSGTGKTLIVLLPLVCAICWYEVVHEEVPEPYLDEEFHIRQAQHYLRGEWGVWEPKLTTPPGLYVASWLLSKAARSFGQEDIVSAENRDLRIISFLGLLGLAKVVDAILERRDKTSRQSKQQAEKDVFARRHVVANVLLFPMLFFFSGLYYTDVISATSVMTVYLFHLKNKAIWIFGLGMLSMAVRQTNVIWVGAYLGALGLQNVLPQRLDAPSTASILDIIQRSGTAVYDPLIGHAAFLDYIKTSLSYAAAVTANIQFIVKALWPYVALIAAFVQFTIWNGGVVLGDKSNHVATVHIAQMLYLWPYIAFFSLPLLLPYLVHQFVPQGYLPNALQTGGGRTFRPRLDIAIPIVIAMLAIVHLNTIVHPFTLADNRHYMFYVFRHLQQHPTIKYLVVPVYFTCAWAVLAVLADTVVGDPPLDDAAQTKKNGPSRLSEESNHAEHVGLRVSWVLIWLGATALSLCTAPLVEPRYCLLPWLMWRLHVPTFSSSNQTPQVQKDNVRWKRWTLYANRLWAETAWFLAINGITCYMFIYRGFEWQQEPGKVQRFMW